MERVFVRWTQPESVCQLEEAVARQVVVGVDDDGGQHPPVLVMLFGRDLVEDLGEDFAVRIKIRPGVNPSCELAVGNGFPSPGNGSQHIVRFVSGILELPHGEEGYLARASA
jgi:hypothetical protein